MLKPILIAATSCLLLNASAQASETQPQTRAQVTMQKQFTLNIAGMDIKGLMPGVDRARVECRIQKQDADYFGRSVLGSASVEFPVTQHLQYGGAVQSGPVSLGINIGDGYHNTPEDSAPTIAHRWHCELQLHNATEGWRRLETGSNGYCTVGGTLKWWCSVAGSTMNDEPKGQF
ncbi:MAG: hypothetical protein PHH47_05465 [Gallionella sp.]|nr:hypothetical protein [Gallionella sp.]MDD4945530.1 hypothetical protein [Gallionella sp.]MDD5611852.1 hypothetical protein [Gallionella sp.]